MAERRARIAVLGAGWWSQGWHLPHLSRNSEVVIAAIIGGAISLLFWRFMCELYMLFFRISDDVRELKEMKSGPTPPAASPASSDF